MGDGRDGNMDYQRLSEWAEYLRSKGRKENSVDNYVARIGILCKALEGTGVSSPEEIGEREIRVLLERLDVSENTKRAYMDILGYFLVWATGRNAVKEADLLWNTVEPKRLFIDKGDFERLLSVADRRERVILLMGGCMGLRRAEICDARYCDMVGDRMRVMGKGHGQGKEAWVHIPKSVRDAIWEWTDERRSMGIEDRTDTIVASLSRGALDRMRPGSLGNLLYDLGERAGVRVTPHSLRRLFATSLYDARVDMIDIKTLMRHENVNTTINCYIRTDRNRLDGIVDGLFGEI